MNRYEKLMAGIAAGKKILLDGATGSEVERRGVPRVSKAWTSAGAKTHPDLVRQIHADYLALGARIIISNTFATSRNILRDAGWEDDFELLNRRGVELAVEARAQSDRPDALVAGAMSHWAWGEEPTVAELGANAKEQAAIFADAGADLIILEMMVRIDKMRALIEASLPSGLPVWVGFTTRIDEHGVVRLRDGETLEEAVAALRGHDIPLAFIMHTDVHLVDDSLDVLQRHFSGPVGVYAHTGGYRGRPWIREGIIHPDEYAQASERWLGRGVQVLGTCCGLGPEHIEALVALFDGA